MQEKKKRINPQKLFLILFLVSISATSTYFGIDYFSNLPRKKEKLAKVELKDELIIFTNKMLPEVYKGILKINDEIIKIEKEIDRLNKISKEFPQQKNIVDLEINMWSKSQKDLQNVLITIQKSIETIYVTYLVNKEKGKERIQNEKENLNKIASDAMDASPYSIEKKQIEGKGKGILDKIKGIFKKNK
ncbi:MAG: hypothetical protein HQK79_02395 [Desulfobacterales bacterium]|nr:hypothetical protein [Desulfobacterales bacterium]